MNFTDFKLQSGGTEKNKNGYADNSQHRDKSSARSTRTTLMQKNPTQKYHSTQPTNGRLQINIGF